MNINLTNGAMVAGGGLMMILKKKAPILGSFGPILAVGLGLADMTGILTFDQIAAQIRKVVPIPSFYGQSYATNNVLPYIDYPERY